MPVLSGRRLLAAVAMVALPLACQPVEDIDDLDSAETGAGGGQEEDRPGAPVAGAPATLAEAVSRGESEAAQWQDGARLTEVLVELADDGHANSTRLVYLAADADRLLAVEVTAAGVQQQRPTLAGIMLEPVPGAALEEIPELPGDAREPSELAEAAEETFDACDVDGDVAAVIYATGAPQSWNSEVGEWSAPLMWTATATTADGAGVVLDPVTAEPTDCLSDP